jgi:hypothetical protein
MKRFAVLALSALLAFAFSLPAAAGELAGVSMPDKMETGGRTLTLVGLGVRSKTIFAVKVYVAGLYMETPDREAAVVLSSDQPKALAMEFVYSEVSGRQLQDAWKEGFAANTPKADAGLSARMDTFVGLFTTPLKKGERVLLSYLPGTGTTVNIAGREAAPIPGADFATALFAIWFGDKPADAGLKAAVLK